MTKSQLDTRGLLCPLPVLKLRKAIMGLNAGDQITVYADDPAAEIDVPHYCQEAGHTLLSLTRENGDLHFDISVGAKYAD